MKMYDCDVCLSAGSVNQWGYCEICGEEFEDPQSLVDWNHIARPQVVKSGVALGTTAAAELTPVGRDAA